MSYQTQDLIFDATAVAPDAGYDPIPNGSYALIVIDGGVIPTKAGTGTRLSLVIEVFDGIHKGRKIFMDMNIKNPSAAAQKIAEGQLSALCHAVGVLQMTSATQLFNRPFVGAVVVKKDAGYDPKNEIRSFHAYTGELPASTAPAARKAAAPSAAVRAPWDKS